MKSLTLMKRKTCSRRRSDPKLHRGASGMNNIFWHHTQHACLQPCGLNQAAYVMLRCLNACLQPCGLNQAAYVMLRCLNVLQSSCEACVLAAVVMQCWASMCSVCRASRECGLALHRHWPLIDALHHTPELMAAVRTFKEGAAGRQVVLYVLASMGIPLEQARLSHSQMKVQFKTPEKWSTMLDKVEQWVQVSSCPAHMVMDVHCRSALSSALHEMSFSCAAIVLSFACVMHVGGDEMRVKMDALTCGMFAVQRNTLAPRNKRDAFTLRYDSFVVEYASHLTLSAADHVAVLWAHLTHSTHKSCSGLCDGFWCAAATCACVHRVTPGHDLCAGLMPSCCRFFHAIVACWLPSWLCWTCEL